MCIIVFTAYFTEETVTCDGLNLVECCNTSICGWCANETTSKKFLFEFWIWASVQSIFMVPATLSLVQFLNLFTFCIGLVQSNSEGIIRVRQINVYFFWSSDIGRFKQCILKCLGDKCTIYRIVRNLLSKGMYRLWRPRFTKKPLILKVCEEI